jgi:c-di-GMP-binding flagellar brake protein YcgR
MPKPEDRRAEKRIDHKASKLKIVFTSDTPGLLGKTFTGSTVDISASGLQITLNTAVPVDSTMDVRIILDGDSKEYFLSSKVRWCNKSDQDNTYHVGLALQDLFNTKTDYKSWRAVFKS